MENRKQKEILEEIQEFFSDLNRPGEDHSTELEKNDYVSALKNKIPETEKTRIDENFTTSEILKAIGDLALQKSPGSDGLPPEFYKQFKNIISEDLTELYNNLENQQELPDSMREGIIKCIYKKGEREDIRNWRPISLLNYDYKIYTKVLTNRISKALQNTIGPEQTAGVQNRTIIENLQLNREIIAYTSINDIKGAMISLDQEKAFDMVNWNVLFKTLKQRMFFFSNYYRIQLLYKNTYSRVKVNGKMSGKISLKRGVRQGC